MRTLVTGANGFIGSHLCRVLVAAGHEVTAIDLPGSTFQNLEGIACHKLFADVTNPQTLRNLFHGIEVVFHLAALTSIAWGGDIFEVNFGGTVNVLNEALNSGVRRFVFMSSLVVHGFRNFRNADETTPTIRTGIFTRPYITSKIRSEQLLLSKKEQIEVVIIRPGYNIYGPFDKLTSTELLRRIAQKKLLGYVGRGDKELGYVYAENLAYGLLCAGSSPNAPGNIYVISDYEPPYAALNLLLGHFSSAFGTEAKIASVPLFLILPIAVLTDIFYFFFLRKKLPLLSTYAINTATHHLHFSPEKACKEIGYKQLVSFEDGIWRTVSWYKASQ